MEANAKNGSSLANSSLFRAASSIDLSLKKNAKSCCSSLRRPSTPATSKTNSRGPTWNESSHLYFPDCACKLSLSQFDQRENAVAETKAGPTVADLFRRAQAMRQENAQTSYRDIAKQIAREFSGGPFPPTYNLTIPEQDARAPEED